MFKFIFFMIFVYISYKLYVKIYFKSKKFILIKDSIKKYTQDCNELNNHIEELKSSYEELKSLDYGDSNINDTSNYDMKRKEWAKEIKSNRTYGNAPKKQAQLVVEFS